MTVRFAYQANCWGDLGGNAVGVTSITQLTYRTFGDIDRAIREIGAAGYEGVELFDGNLLDYRDRPGALRKILGDAGVKLVAVYAGANFIFNDILGEELARIERAAAAAAEAGAEHLVVGGGAKRARGSEPDDIRRLGDALEQVVRLAGAAGLTAHYHPHLSTIVEGPDEVREVFRHTAINFCPDTAHLAAAGGDPAQQVREFRDRISYVHLKGLQREPFAFTPIDTGDLDNGAVIDALREIGFAGWVASELDSWPDPKGGAEQSLRFARQRFSQGG
ncbi:MAG TPA: sugar phosphate isomerase/epimerase [Alphaproteobacteria bacterium]|nr:sugar phosphate isomerase/epimerase [Alphaproteobacteria bacterium]